MALTSKQESRLEYLARLPENWHESGLKHPIPNHEALTLAREFTNAFPGDLARAFRFYPMVEGGVSCESKHTDAEFMNDGSGALFIYNGDPGQEPIELHQSIARPFSMASKAYERLRSIEAG